MSDETAAPVCETEVEFLARAIIAQHGAVAAEAAVHHLDELVKRNSPRRDTWTAVVGALRSSPSRDAA